MVLNRAPNGSDDGYGGTCNGALEIFLDDEASVRIGWVLTRNHRNCTYPFCYDISETSHNGTRKIPLSVLPSRCILSKICKFMLSALIKKVL
jgi:hypothetical protein